MKKKGAGWPFHRFEMKSYKIQEEDVNIGDVPLFLFSCFHSISDRNIEASLYFKGSIPKTVMRINIYAILNRVRVGE